MYQEDELEIFLLEEKVRAAYIPISRAVEIFGYIVISLPVSTHEEDFVECSFGTLVVETGELVFETLPLRLLPSGVKGWILFIRAVYQPKICSCL